MKRVQNRVAESRFTMPVTIAYGVGVWLLCGLIQQQWWVQFACFVMSVFLMVELNNANALIRIYSRMVSASFVVLSAMACFLFPSVQGGIAMLCMAAALLTLFNSYQDKRATGWTFYTYVCLSLGSLACVHLLWLVPIFWLAQFLCVMSLGWRTFAASLLGLLLPYWIAMPLVMWQQGGRIAIVAGHFMPLADLQPLQSPTSMSLPCLLCVAFLVAVSLTGTIHYVRTSSRDKIRIRQLYYCLILLNFAATLLLLLQPAQYDLLLRLMIITASPLIAHFLALTGTRFTNIAFYVICVTALGLTLFNLWSSSFIS